MRFFFCSLGGGAFRGSAYKLACRRGLTVTSVFKGFLWVSRGSGLEFRV